MAEYAVLVGGALFAAMISGATGFGFALTATAIWMQWLPPQIVVVLCVVIALLLNIAYLPYFWREIEIRRLWPFLVGGVAGVPLGVYALRDFAPGTLRATVGMLLVGYSLYALVPRRPVLLRMADGRARALDGGVGFLGGLCGGIGGLSGFLPALWCGIRGFAKSEQRGTVQAYILAVNVVTLAWLGGVIGFDADAARYLLIALPAVALGAALGLKVFRRVDTAMFNRVVLWTLLGCGALLVVNAR